MKENVDCIGQVSFIQTKRRNNYFGVSTEHHSLLDMIYPASCVSCQYQHHTIFGNTYCRRLVSVGSPIAPSSLNQHDHIRSCAVCHGKPPAACSSEQQTRVQESRSRPWPRTALCGDQLIPDMSQSGKNRSEASGDTFCQEVLCDDSFS